MKKEESFPEFDEENGIEHFRQWIGSGRIIRESNPRRISKPKRLSQEKSLLRKESLPFLDMDSITTMEELLQDHPDIDPYRKGDIDDPVQPVSENSSLGCIDQTLSSSSENNNAPQLPSFEEIDPHQWVALTQHEGAIDQVGIVQRFDSQDGLIIQLEDGKEGVIPWEEVVSREGWQKGDQVWVSREVSDPGPVFRLRLLKCMSNSTIKKTSSHRHLPSPPIPIEKNTFVIDGSNLSRLSRVGNTSSLKPVLAICYELVRNKGNFVCVFDANESYTLQRNRKEPDGNWIYQELCYRYHLFFRESPGGREADELILRLAHQKNGLVISNDRFHKPGEQYHIEYPWLDVSSRRLIPVEITPDFLKLKIPLLNLYLHLDQPLTRIYERLLTVLD